MLSTLPAAVRGPATVLLAELVLFALIGAWCAWRRSWRMLFCVAWGSVAVAVVSAVLQAMPYVNSRVALQADGPRLNEIAVSAGDLAVWSGVPDFFRYYALVDMVPLQDADAAARFFASGGAKLCLLRDQDLRAVEAAAGRRLVVRARYRAQDRGYVLVSPEPLQSP